MKIYRFVPTIAGHAVVPKTLVGRWWPDGIEMGTAMDHLFPKTSLSAHPDNVYHQFPIDSQLTDFPAFALNVPLISEKAAAVLRSAGVTNNFVPITIDGKPYFAVLYGRIPGIFRSESSEGLALPGGEVFHYYRRDFDTSKTTTEFFSLPVFGPFSDLYFTERLMDVVASAELSGLESSELVYDNGPLTVRYPPIDRTCLPQGTFRQRMESELLYWRCSLANYDAAVIQEALESAAADGWISFDDSPITPLPPAGTSNSQTNAKILG